jgi:heptosyltransferase I
LTSNASKADLAPPGEIDRILIVRLSSMGDVIHTLPAVQALRDAFPGAHIGWLIEERWAELLCAPSFPRCGARSAQRPLVDEVHTINLKNWGKSLFSVSTLQQAAKVWNDVRDAPYDIALDLQGAMRSAVLARLSGSQVVYGPAEPRESPAALWYTRKVITSGRHVVEQYFSVAQAVSEKVQPIPSVKFPYDAKAQACVDGRLEKMGIGKFAILNPGAGWGAKRWPAERYGEVARRLAQVGISAIANYGPDEQDLASAVEAASQGTAQTMNCTISELIALTRRARVFIGGDTGPLHLAAALQVPVVAIYGPTDPIRNGPYRTNSVVLRGAESVTTLKRHAVPDEAMLGIGVDEVSSALSGLLGGGGE